MKWLSTMPSFSKNYCLLFSSIKLPLSFFDNVYNRADQLEAKLREKELEMQTKDEEAAEVIKKIQQVDTDKETAQTQLAETNTKLEETDKRATEVSHYESFFNRYYQINNSRIQKYRHLFEFV